MALGRPRARGGGGPRHASTSSRHEIQQPVRAAPVADEDDQQEAERTVGPERRTEESVTRHPVPGGTQLTPQMIVTGRSLLGPERIVKAPNRPRGCSGQTSPAPNGSSEQPSPALQRAAGQRGMEMRPSIAAAAMSVRWCEPASPRPRTTW